MTEDDKYIQLAFSEAKKRKGLTEPNPAVGAVLVKNGTLLGQGTHLGAGFPHAEVEALKGLSDESIKGSTLYVTLEPCCHTGRTPPCTDLILKKEIKKVVYAFKDPNPIVCGKGAEKLKKANVEVVELNSPEATAFYEGYSYWQKNKRPFLTLKIALSRDGKMSGPQNSRIKLTGEEADKFTHQMRLESSAILTTSETVNADDPLLDCRLVSQEKKKIFIVDRFLKLKEGLKVFQSAHSVTVLTLPEQDKSKIQHLEKQGVKIVETANLLKTLGDEALHTVWVEAGFKFSEYLLSQKYVNRLIVYETPVVVGEGVFSFPLSDLTYSSTPSKEVSLGADLVKQWDFKR